MRAALLLAVLLPVGLPARAGKLEALIPPAASAESLAPLYDGARVRIGQSAVDLGAPGAPALLGALRAEPPLDTVIGTFARHNGQVVNAFTYGYDGIDEHKKAVPAGLKKEHLGGYIFHMEPDGSYQFAGSGYLPANLTGKVKRGILRYLGVLPAQETFRQKLWRIFLELMDWAS